MASPQIGRLTRCHGDTVARAIEHLIAIGAIRVTGDNAGTQAARYTLLHDTPQLAGLPQDAVSKRVQTPQLAGLVQPVGLPSEGGTPQVAGVVSIPIKIPEDHIHGLHALLALLQVKRNGDL